MHITCDMAMDLAGLYKDGLASEDSTRAVEQHLKECPFCRRYYKRLAPAKKMTLPREEEPATAADAAWEDISRRLGRRRLWTRLATGAVAVAGLGTLITGLVVSIRSGSAGAACCESRSRCK